jgi:hypothetical protein
LRPDRDDWQDFRWVRAQVTNACAPTALAAGHSRSSP